MRGWNSAGSGKAGAWPASSEWQAVAGRQRRIQVGLASAVRGPSLAGCAQQQTDQQTSNRFLHKRALRNSPARPSHVEHSSLP